MSWVQDIFSVFGRLGFFEIVYEYQQGLYVKGGLVIEKKIRNFESGNFDWNTKKKPLEEIIANEKEINSKINWFKRHFSSTKSLGLPQGYRRDFFGRINHPDRYDKLLSPGIYFHWPIVDYIRTESKQETIANLENVTFLTNDKDNGNVKNITVSCNIRYEMINFYKAFISVNDYERSLKEHTLSILSKYCMGHDLDFWKSKENIEKVQDLTLKDLREIATRDWGLKIHNIYITTVAFSNIHRVLYEGPALQMSRPIVPSEYLEEG